MCYSKTDVRNHNASMGSEPLIFLLFSTLPVFEVTFLIITLSKNFEVRPGNKNKIGSYSI